MPLTARHRQELLAIVALLVGVFVGLTLMPTDLTGPAGEAAGGGRLEGVWGGWARRSGLGRWSGWFGPGPGAGGRGAKGPRGGGGKKRGRRPPVGKSGGRRRRQKRKRRRAPPRGRGGRADRERPDRECPSR